MVPSSVKRKRSRRKSTGKTSIPGSSNMYASYPFIVLFGIDSCVFDRSQNIRVIAKYYTRITLTRLNSLLDLSAQQAEEILGRLVVSGTIWARIDRPAGIINFRNKRSAEDVMNDWSSDMQKLLGFVEKTWMEMNAAQAAQSKIKA